MVDVSKNLSKEDSETWNIYITRLKENEVSPPPRSIYGDGIPSRRLDLHGLTIHEAWMALREFVEAHQAHGSNELVVITGRSGRISYEFTDWCRRIEGIRAYEPIETRSGKVGSYRIKLRKIT